MDGVVKSNSELFSPGDFWHDLVDITSYGDFSTWLILHIFTL
jgi:hypothetical protein